MPLKVSANRFAAQWLDEYVRRKIMSGIQGREEEEREKKLIIAAS